MPLVWVSLFVYVLTDLQPEMGMSKSCSPFSFQAGLTKIFGTLAITFMDVVSKYSIINRLQIPTPT